MSDISPLSGLTALATLALSRNKISEISPLSGLTALTSLSLFNNKISELSPLVENAGLGTGDRVNVQQNPLSAVSLDEHIPALQERGVDITF